jgi:DNA-binding transcriptional MerR regulator
MATLALQVLVFYPILLTPVSGPTGAPGWPADELLRRANAWSERRGLAPLTRSTLLAWRRAGLVPPPRFQSLGRGHGSAQYWSTRAYRRTLQICRLRGQGLNSHSLQRLSLWLGGADIDLAQVRLDLDRAYREQIRHVHAEMGTASWSWRTAERQPSIQRVDRLAMMLIEEVGKAGLTDSEPSMLPEGTLAGMAAVVRRVVVHPLVRGWVRALLLEAGGEFQRRLREGFERVPEEWRALLPVGTTALVETTLGLLTDPGVGQQPLLDALDRCPDSVLLEMRDAAHGWNEFWSGTMALAGSLLAHYGSIPSSPLRSLAERLSLWLALLSRYHPVKTTADALAVMSILVLLHDRGAFAGGRLGEFARARGGRLLLGWLALHLEELQSRAGSPPTTLQGLAAVLPSEKRVLWEIAFGE